MKLFEMGGVVRALVPAGAVGGVVRALVSAVGGYLVGRGLIDSETAATLGGATTTFIVAVWSILEKRKK